MKLVPGNTASELRVLQVRQGPGSVKIYSASIYSSLEFKQSHWLKKVT